MAKITCNFISYTLHRAVDITVVIPSVTCPDFILKKKEELTHEHEPYPVLYLLHGYANNHATWNGYSMVELFAEERQICVVMISAENKFYWDHGKEDNYFTFLSEELPCFIENTFHVSTRKEDCYICGLSMGGYGSLLHGLSNPDMYAAIGSLSGAVEGAAGNNSPIPSELIEKDIKERKKIPPLYIACGNDDFLIEPNKKFVEFIKENKLDCTYEFVDGYQHEWRFWNLEVERFMDWIPRTDAYAGTKRSV
ncbi:MAG: hypothetical protein HUJ53_07010 [Holdemanella sp.]|nr:hypothetical protein [Holdemanella sp.]